ncbi:MAG: phosphoserine phosphatase SerB [Paracoccaceae bacterium]
MNSFLVVTSARNLVSADVDAALNALAARGFKGGAAQGLDDYAVQIPFTAETPAFAPANWLPDTDLDMNITPAQGREKRVLVADMDSTIIGVECIDELADYAGVKAEVAEITERAMQGLLDFEAALVARVALLEGLPLGKLAQCYDERVRLNLGARRLVQTMVDRGAYTALVSGGFAFFSSRVAAEAGFDEHRANVLQNDGERLTGTVEMPILGRKAKLDALLEICAARNIAPEDAIALGDGANDLAMVTAAGLGVAYRAKPALAEHANAVLNHSDLRAVLALQGLVV